MAYGEAVGVLAGDALLAEALRLALAYPTPEIARELTQATLGMIGGQYLDVRGEGDPETMNRLKTGCLFSAAVGLGLWAAGIEERAQAPWRAFGDELGLLFQLVDDLLDGDGFVALNGADATRARRRRGSGARPGAARRDRGGHERARGARRRARGPHGLTWPASHPSPSGTCPGAWHVDMSAADEVAREQVSLGGRA